MTHEPVPDGDGQLFYPDAGTDKVQSHILTRISGSSQTILTGFVPRIMLASIT
jgi:hypothetical protein